jgi:hypothetical protein
MSGKESKMVVVTRQDELGWSMGEDGHGVYNCVERKAGQIRKWSVFGGRVAQHVRQPAAYGPRHCSQHKAVGRYQDNEWWLGLSWAKPVWECSAVQSHQSMLTYRAEA